MIARITGRLEAVSDSSALIDAGAGLWYEVLAPAFNPLETVCLAFGLPRSAELLRSNRLAGMRELCGFLGLLGPDGETLDPAALREL